MERLKVANDEKLTELGKKFHTFIALSSKKFLLLVLISFLFSFYVTNVTITGNKLMYNVLVAYFAFVRSF